MTIDKELLAQIEAKPESERTPVEVALLDAAAEQTNTDNEDNIDWSKAFEHPRFKELVTRASKAEQKLKEQERKAAEQERKRLVEQSEYKTLYEQTQSQLEELQNVQDNSKIMQDALQKTLNAELDQLSPDMRKLVPVTLPINEQLEWLATNKALLVKKKPKDIGSGRRNLSKSSSNKTTVPELSADEKRIADAYGYTAEEYVKFRDNLPAEQTFVASNQETSSDEEEGEDNE